MGLMGNIAEVSDLRGELMNSDYVSVFVQLLEIVEDGIEISYNSAGVLSHMLSDGRNAWTITEPSRADVELAIAKAIEKWKLDARRFINYR